MILAKGKAEGEINGGVEFTAATSEKYGIEFFEAVVNELSEIEFVVFLDDFHYISEDAQIDRAHSFDPI